MKPEIGEAGQVNECGERLNAGSREMVSEHRRVNSSAGGIFHELFSDMPTETVCNNSTCTKSPPDLQKNEPG